MSERKNDAGAYRDAVRRILLEEWDPIGIKDEPRAHDEYDIYIDDLYALLIDENVSRDALASRLHKIVREQMELTASPVIHASDQVAADGLIALRSNIAQLFK